MSTSNEFDSYNAWLYFVLRKNHLTTRCNRQQTITTYSCRNSQCPFILTSRKPKSRSYQTAEFVPPLHNHEDFPDTEELIEVDIQLFLHYRKAGKEYKLSIKDPTKSSTFYVKTLQKFEKSWDNIPHKKPWQVIQYFYTQDYKIQDIIEADKKFVEHMKSYFADGRTEPLVYQGYSFNETGTVPELKPFSLNNVVEEENIRKVPFDDLERA